MPDLTPHTQPIATAIYEHYERTAGDWRRDHLGASVVGHPCNRYLWYTFRWAANPKFNGRLLRLFDTGNREEARLVADLLNIGVKVLDKDPETGRQIRVSVGDYFGGSLDGMAQGVPQGGDKWHVVEFKTHSDTSFKALKKKGVAESKPRHYIQMAIYMHLTGVERALYVARNKNTDELYTERIKADPALAQAQIDRALRVIESRKPPGRISDNPAHWECKWCPFFGVCHQGEAMEKSCRTCKHWAIGKCELGVKADERVGCDRWEMIG